MDRLITSRYTDVRKIVASAWQTSHKEVQCLCLNGDGSYIVPQDGPFGRALQGEMHRLLHRYGRKSLVLVYQPPFLRPRQRSMNQKSRWLEQVRKVQHHRKSKRIRHQIMLGNDSGDSRPHNKSTLTATVNSMTSVDQYALQLFVGLAREQG